MRNGFVAIDEGKIAQIGFDHHPKLHADQIINLGGSFLMAGFQDNHVHFMEGGAALASVDLRSANTPDDFTKRIADHAANLPTGQWVLNGNWDETLWSSSHPEAGLPHRDWIDAATPDHPVFVIRLDGHSALANSKALALAGVEADTPNPEGGVFVRDPAGRLTGLLKNAAMERVLETIPAPSTDVLMRQFSLAQDHALENGLVKVHAVTAYPSETTMLEIFQDANSRGLMRIRAQVSTPLDSWEDMAADSEHGTGDDFLSWGGVKGLVDGSLGSRTAWFHQPYADRPDELGFPATEPDRFVDWMKSADAAGLELSIHAIGDKGIDLALDGFEAIAADHSVQKTFRLEHVQHPSEEAIDRIAEMGVIAAMHPYHAVDDGRWAEDRIGASRLATAYPFGSLIRAGARVSFGSDWPVAPLSPLLGIEAAVTRATLDGKNPDGWVAEEKITVAQALSAYTRGNADAFGELNASGTIEVGKRADLVILSDNPFTVDPNDIGDITVNRTIINGEEVFRRDR